MTVFWFQLFKCVEEMNVLIKKLMENNHFC